MASTWVADRADFPDSPTERGLKHLKELTDLARQGVRVVQFYLLGRGDCTHMSIDEEIDPGYGDGVRTALESGVEFLAYRARLNPAGIGRLAGTLKEAVARPSASSLPLKFVRTDEFALPMVKPVYRSGLSGMCTPSRLTPGLDPATDPKIQ